MYSLTRSAIFSVCALLITGCATLNPSDEGRASFHDSALNDQNRAPASLVPPALSEDGSVRLDPLYMRTQADYYFSLGETYSLEGDAKKALEFFKMTLVYDDASPTVRMRMATEYIKLGMVSESLAQAEEAVVKDPKNIEARLLLGGLYSSMKFYPKALEQYQKVLGLSPKNTEAPLYIGAIYSEQKQYDKAVKYFEALAKSPDYNTPHLAYYYVGKVRAEQTGKKYQQAAEKAFKMSLQEKPNYADAVLSLGSLYMKNKDAAAAVTLYKKFQKENSPSNRVAEVLAQIYIDQGAYDLAYEQLEYAESADPEELNTKMKMALILIEQREYKKAIAKLEDILKEVPDSDKIQFYLAAVYEESNMPEKAIAYFKKIPKESQFYGEAVVHSAYLLKNMGQADAAIEVVETALKNRKDLPQVYAIYASILDDKQQYEKAVQVLSTAIGQFPENAQLRFYYGTMNDRLGHKEIVVAQMKKVLEIEPAHVQGMNYLAFTWAEMGVRLKDAENLARKAHELEPKDGYILDTLGWILYKQGRNAESIKFLEAAWKYQPQVSVIAEHLGDAYYKQAMVEKAKTMYKKAVDLETDKDKQSQIEEKLTAIENQLIKDRLPASVKTSVVPGT